MCWMCSLKVNATVVYIDRVIFLLILWQVLKIPKSVSTATSAMAKIIRMHSFWVKYQHSVQTLHEICTTTQKHFLQHTPKTQRYIIQISLLLHSRTSTYFSKCNPERSAKDAKVQSSFATHFLPRIRSQIFPANLYWKGLSVVLRFWMRGPKCKPMVGPDLLGS